MELWIWVIALSLGVLIPLIAITFVATKALHLGKKISPLATDVKLLQQALKDNPEAVRFFTEAAKSPNEAIKSKPH